MNRRRLLSLSASVLGLAACAPVIQQAGAPGAAFTGPRLEDDAFVSFDGARLGLRRWMPPSYADGEEPWAVVIGLHGMNDYSQAFHLAGQAWAAQGIATYAYDQRGFGRSPQRGVWGGPLMMEDLRVCAALVRARHPKAILAITGVSMGGAVALTAMASDRPPQADRLVLASPAVWGWSTQPLPNKTSLWLLAHVDGKHVLTPPEWLVKRVTPTDNREELMGMSRDPQMIWGARIDTTYGIVSLMEAGYRSVGKSPVPTAYLYGAHDQIIPRNAAFPAAQHLNPEDVSAYYPEGYHLLLVDHAAPRVWGDVASFLKDPTAPLPSAPPRIPAADRPANGRQAAARKA
jgi:alpha-beta hydrolase superfamily lysophospholipase